MNTGELNFSVYNGIPKRILNKNGIVTKAVVIQCTGYKRGRLEKNWKLLYSVDNHPHFASLTSGDIEKGDVFNLKYNRNNPNRYILGDEISDIETKEVLIYGLSIPKNVDRIIIVSDSVELFHSEKVNESISIFIDPPNRNFSLLLYAKTKLISNRSFSVSDKLKIPFICID